MYCKNCGGEINDNAVVCIHCGCAVNEPTHTAAPVQTPKTNVLAIVGFVLSFFVPLAGLICSAIGYKRADRDYDGNCKGLALAGTILSAISLAIVVAVVLWVVISWFIIISAVVTYPPAVEYALLCILL